MKKTFGVMICAVIAVACSDDDKASRLQLLTDGTSKNWNITAVSPEETEESCRPGTDFQQDNVWTFSSGGDFNYNHGTLTEGEACSDFKNLTGNWKFTDDESNLLITLLYETGDPSNTFDGDTLVLGSIESLSKDKLVITQDGQTGTFTPK